MPYLPDNTPSCKPNCLLNFYSRYSAGETKVGTTRRFLFFGSSFAEVSDVSPSLFSVVDVGVSGGVLRGTVDPVDEVDRFRFVPACVKFTTAG